VSTNESLAPTTAGEVAAYYQFLTKQMHGLLDRVSLMSNPKMEVLDNGESDSDISWSTNPGG